MGWIVGIFQQMWIFVLLWKMSISIFQKKEYMQMGKAMMGMIVLLVLILQINNGNCGKTDTIFREQINKMERTIGQFDELYTWDSEIKVGINITNLKPVKTIQSQENTTFEGKQISTKNEEKLQKEQKENRFSTIHVESIQLIR